MLYVEVTRDDASARMTHPAPDIDVPAVEDAEQGYDQLEAEHLRMSPRGVRARGPRTLTSEISGHLRHNAAARHEFYPLTRRR
jgi:hypothetical protein